MKFSFRNAAYSKVALVGLDQLISATGNFVIIWLCLTSLPTTSFGSFSYAWNLIALFIVLSRALFGVPVLLDSQSKSPESQADISASLTGATVLGVLAGLITATLYLLGGVNDSSTWIFGLFVLCPLILFHDSIRFLMISLAKVKLIFFFDIFLLICILSFAIYTKRNDFLGWNLILTMACGYAIVSAMFLTINPIHLSLRRLNTLLRLDFHRRSRLLGDAVISWGFGLLSVTIIRIATGDEGIGMFNALIFLFGPVTLITVFITLGLQSEVMRTKEHLATIHKTFLILLSLFPMFWLTLITRVPERFLVSFIGQPTSDMYTTAKPFAIWASLTLGIEMVILFMRAHGKFSEILIIRFTGGVIMLIGFAALLIADSNLEPFIWVGAVSNLIMLLMTLVSLRMKNDRIDYSQQEN